MSKEVFNLLDDDQKELLLKVYHFPDNMSFYYICLIRKILYKG